MSIYDQIAQGTGGRLSQLAMYGNQQKQQQEQNAFARQQYADQQRMQQQKMEMLQGKSQQEGVLKGLEIMGKIAAHGIKTPEEQRPALYQQQLQLLHGLGMDVSKLPQEYQPGLYETAISSLEKEGAKYGMTPVYYTDQQGKLQAAQINAAGGVAPLKVPGGGSWVKPVQLKNLGGTVGAFGYGQQTPAAFTPKTVPPQEQPSFKGEQAAATAEGTARGKSAIESAQELPKIEAEANDTIQQLDELINHPGLPYAVGAGSMLPVIPGTAQADAVTRLEQIQGKQFLQAYQTLKGGGQITEIEGSKAEAAIARMSRAQSVGAFKQAAKEFQSVIKRGLQRAKAKARQGSAQSPSSRPSGVLRYNPATGEFE